MTEIGVQLPEIGVQLRPKPVFNFARNRCSTSSEKPRYVTKTTYRLINHLKSVGDFGQHLNKFPESKVTVGFAASVVLAAIGCGSSS